jgi:hypothetical protein
MCKELAAGLERSVRTVAGENRAFARGLPAAFLLLRRRWSSATDAGVWFAERSPWPPTAIRGLVYFTLGERRGSFQADAAARSIRPAVPALRRCCDRYYRRSAASRSRRCFAFGIVYPPLESSRPDGDRRRGSPGLVGGRSAGGHGPDAAIARASRRTPTARRAVEFFQWSLANAIHLGVARPGRCLVDPRSSEAYPRPCPGGELSQRQSARHDDRRAWIG